MFDIAFHGDGGAAQIKDIAERQGIPPRFLEQIFQDLKRAGLVVSKRGPQGGYHLGEQPGNIHLGTVLEVLEGPILLQPDNSKSKGLGQQVNDALWGELSVSVTNCFNSITIRDLCERAEAMRLKKEKHQTQMYVI